MITRKALPWIALAAGLAALAWYFLARPAPPPAYQTVAAESGDITTAIAASGKLQAVDTVEIGSQVSGQIVALYADYNTAVKRGQVLARIDPGTFAARAEQSAAQAAGARAEVAQAGARVREAQAALLEAQRDYRSKQELTKRGFFPARSLETVEAQVSAARAGLEAARAATSAASAGVRQAGASLQQNRLDIDRAVIRSPIDGVVIDRTIDLGQTVAASLQAPKLFVIAKDLTLMQVEAAVDEADIGRVVVGQRVKFSVDAFPDDEFTGRVAQVRIAGVENQNVVTYTVVIEAPNPSARLLPGMTANAEIVLGELRNVLKIPAAALRWRPAADAPPSAPPGGGFDVGAGGGPGGGGGGGGGRRERMNPDRMVERLDRELDLSDAQTTAVRAVVARGLQSMAAAPRADRRRRREAMREEIAALLMPEQAAKYAATAPADGAGRGRRGAPGLVHVVGPDGRPVARAVRTIEGDGDSVAVVGGVLKAGEQVITGEAIVAGEGG